MLRKDAHTNVATLATKLGVARGTVTNRLRKLEDDQVIVGYTVRLRPHAEPHQIRAWMWVLVEGNQTRALIASLLGEWCRSPARHQRPLGSGCLAPAHRRGAESRFFK